MVISQGAPSVTGSRRWLWYNKGRVVLLQVRIYLQRQTDPAACLQKTCLPSPTEIFLRRNKTKTNIHSGTLVERATPRPWVFELFHPFPPPQPHPILIPPSPRDQVTTRASRHTGGIHHLKPPVLGPYDVHARFFVRPQFAQYSQFSLQWMTLLL